MQKLHVCQIQGGGLQTILTNQIKKTIAIKLTKHIFGTQSATKRKHIVNAKHAATVVLTKDHINS